MYSGGPAKSELLRRVLVAIMMRLSRFIKGGFKGFERSCLWDLSRTCQPPGKAGGGPGRNGLGIWDRAYRDKSIKGGTRRNAQLLPCNSLVN